MINRDESPAERLLRFIEEHNNIYIYGAGNYGHCCLEYINGIRGDKFKGFITSGGDASKEGMQTYKADRLLPLLTENDGVIVAMKSSFQDEVINNNVFNCDYYSVPDTFWSETDIALALQLAPETKFEREYKGDAINRILIIQLEVTYGDVIWSSALIRELKSAYPDSIIDYVINEKHYELIKGCPYVENIFKYGGVERWRVLSEKMMSDIKTFYKDNLSTKTYDVVYLPRLAPCAIGDMWENVLLMACVKAKYRFGHVRCISENEKSRAKQMSVFFTSLIQEREIKHNAYYDAELMGLTHKKCHDYKMELWIDNNEELRNRLIKNKEYIVLGICGSTTNRMWSPDNFIQLITRFEKEFENICFVILGSTESESAASIIENATHSCVNLVGQTTLSEAADVVANSQLYIGVDTGLLQMASASGIPIVEISHVLKDAPPFFAGAAERTGPWLVENIILKPKNGMDGCRYICRRQSHCINQINPQNVYEAAKKMLIKGRRN